MTSAATSVTGTNRELKHNLTSANSCERKTDKIEKCTKRVDEREREKERRRSGVGDENRERKGERERVGKRHVHVRGTTPVLICSRKLLVLRHPPRPTLAPACRHSRPASFVRSFRMHGPESSRGSTMIRDVVSLLLV